MVNRQEFSGKYTEVSKVCIWEKRFLNIAKPKPSKMSQNIIVGESVLLLPSPGQVKMPLSMAELVYIGKKNNLDLLLAMTETLLLDQNVGSGELEEARGELDATEKAFFATLEGLSKSQRRKTQDE